MHLFSLYDCLYSRLKRGWAEFITVNSQGPSIYDVYTEGGGGRAANASDFIVNLPILGPSLRLYDFNGKSTIFTLANYLTRCMSR